MSGPADRIRVSVVVPVYNPGAHLDALIESLETQTLAQDEFEVVFSDDGSTDDTPGRLDRLAAERENVIVLHEPNSGWPGRPRNLGMDIARGEYVFFVDQDDWLGTEALERMYTFAVANNSDIVIGRYAGHHRGVARATFHRTQPNATLANTPLMDSLTPHKMFRTAFLREHALRFPEGRRRLEDHVFVAQAYFLAKKISVLADYLCYFHVRRDDEGNAAYLRIDPASYYANVREVVDIVLAHTEPGAVRDRFLRRTLRTELLGRLDGNTFLRQDAVYQRAVFDEARRLAIATMPLTVDAGLTPQQKVRAALLRAGRLDDLITCVRQFTPVRPAARLLDLNWNGAGELVVEAHCALVGSTGEPWRYDAVGEQTYLAAPGGLREPLPRAAAECTKQLAAATVQIVLRRREDSEEWPVPTQCAVTVERDARQAWATMAASARIDPRSAAGGSALKDGVWDVYARVSQTGWTKDAALGSQRTKQAARNRRAILLSGQIIAPRWTKPRGALSIDVGAHVARVVWGSGLVPAMRVRRTGEGRNALRALLPLIVLPGDDPALRLRLVGPTGHLDLPLDADRRPSGELSFDVELPALAEGCWDVSLALDPDSQPSPAGTKLAVSSSGRVRVRRAVPADLATDLSRVKKESLVHRIRRRLRAARRRR